MKVKYLDVTVQRMPRRQFGVFGITTFEDGTSSQELLEGGFFTEAAADSCYRAYLNDIIEDAERKAGWDPNP